nr:EAL domain-containing protein [Treponema sp.]
LVNYLMVGINIVYSGYLVLKYRKLFPKRTYASIVAIYPLILIPMIIEFIWPYRVVEPFGNALGILLIALSIQRPEELLDFKTGFFSRNSYIENFNKAKINNKRTCHIFVNISNYRNLRNIIGYDTGFELSNFISQLIRKNISHLKVYPDLYYLKNGEFRIVLGPRYLNKTKEVAEIINNSFLKSFYYKDIELNFVANVCVVRVPEEINTLETLFNFGKDLLNPKFHTGEILYAKDIYRTDYYQELQHLDTIMEKGFINGNYTVHYQPIYDLKEKAFNSAEAFIRLNDDRYGFIDLENLIPAAENAGIIHRLDNFVVEQVCQFIKKPGFEETGLKRITVNFSLIHCMQDNFPSQYLEILDIYQVPKDKIILELAESEITAVQEKLVENLKILNEAGVPISIDNFGKSYSNTQRLGLIPMKIIKFDKSLVKSLDEPNISILVKKMMEVSKALNVKIAISGVETPSNFSFFEKEDCDYLQGYFFTRPIPEKHLLRFLKNAREKKLSLN